MITSISRILKRLSSCHIYNKIASGKMVYFESPLEEMAFRYVPNEIGRLGTYYLKYYGQDEYKIDFDSTFVLKALMEGHQISKNRYDNYHLMKGVLWNRQIKTPAIFRSVET